MKTGRILFVLGMGAVWAGVLGARLVQLQVVDHERYARKAERQQQRVVELDAPRGTLYDRAGRELAVSLEVASVAVDPSRVDDPEAVVEALTRHLGLDAERQRALRKDLDSDREFAWVERKVDPPRSEPLRELDLAGVILLPEAKRYYPLREVAASVLGYVGTDGPGLAGIEYLYDPVVVGSPGRRTVVRDGRLGTVLFPHRPMAEPRPGQDLHLTLDAAVQHRAEELLREAVERENATRGTAVVLDPSTGAVLAMANVPGFDPNRFGEASRESWRNLAVTDAYEPGSTFKMVTLAAALEAGAVTLDQVIDCELGGINLHGRRIHDHHPFGLLDVRTILAKSSNVGAIKLGLEAGKERLAATIEAFGFGRPTGVDLPSESAGLLRPLERWSALTPAYLSFGQGLSVTALQLANAFAAVANGGRLYRPYLVERVGSDPPRQPELVGTPVSPSTMAALASVLEGVVLPGGTATAAAVEGFRAAGKTGTAQKAVDGRYSSHRFVASFVGFAPLDDPEIVCVIVLDEPWPRYHGGQAAAPVFRELVGWTLLHLGRRPDREVPDRWPGEVERDIVTLLAANPPVLATPEDELRVGPRDEKHPGTVPDLVGLTARQAVYRAGGLGLRLALDGSGVVARQSPPAGTPLETAGDLLALELTPEAL